MKTAIFLFFIFFLNPFFGRASECGCDLEEDFLSVRQLFDAELVFKGHLVSKRTEYFSDLGYRYVATFFIDELISGTPESETVDIEYGYDWDCVRYFYPGPSYIIFANTRLDFPYYQTDYCSPTKKWANLSKKDHQLLFDFQNGKSELTWKYRFDRVYAKGRLRQKKPIGIWEYFFFDGRLKETGYYLEGEKEGEWLTFFHPLSVCMVLNLPPSRPSICDFSQVSPPNPAGWVSSVTPYTEGKINGTVLTYDESGCIRSEANYVDGVLVGSIQTY